MIRDHAVIASLPKPLRHHDIIQCLHDAGLKHAGPEWEGFLTSEGRYVGRKEAVYVALRAGQITLPKRCESQDDLYSEDLW